jgi:hypothetical protein
MTLPATPPPQNDSGRILRIVGLVVIGIIVLCGLLGSCLFLVMLVAPLFQTQ